MVSGVKSEIPSGKAGKPEYNRLRLYDALADRFIRPVMSNQRGVNGGSFPVVGLNGIYIKCESSQ